MSKKTIAAILMTSILCIASCSNNTPATTTTAANAATTTVAETTSTTTETVEDTAKTTTEVAETTAPVTEEPIDETGPLDETILEKNVFASTSYQSAYDQFINIIHSGTYTFTMDQTEDGYPSVMTTVSDPALGVYYDGDIGVILRCILQPDGTAIKFDDDKKYYVNFPTEKATETTEYMYPCTAAIFPVNEDITTADVVQLPTGNKAYRFTIVPENNASTETKYTENVYVYFDETTGYPTATYADDCGTTIRWFKITDTVDPIVFEIPSDYNELSYEDYINSFLL